MDDFSAFGGSTHEMRGMVAETLGNMAALKNVPVKPALRDQLVMSVLERMSAPDRRELAAKESKAVAALTREINRHLDATVEVWIMDAVASLEGKKGDLDDPLVRGVAQDIFTQVAGAQHNKQCIRWPGLSDLADLLGRHYAGKARGPIVEVSGDGTVSTRWCLGLDFHRDPKEGPANIEENGARRVEEYWTQGTLHRPHQDGPAVIYTDAENKGMGPCRIEEYWVKGQRHRDHREGPAMIYTHYKNFDLSGEEYFANGKLHRPSELGPAVTHWDRAGEPVMMLYYENGQHHRDPSEGPAWWHVHDARTDRTVTRPFTELRYYVRGQLHRDEKDGPAWSKRDNETGVLLTEEYWRDGDLHREDGPAVMTRWPEGTVSYQAWWRGGRMRDASEGPCAMWHDPQGRPTGEEWCVGGGHERDASEGPGRIHRDLVTGEVREEFFAGGDFRRAPDGPATVTRDREGHVVERAFWDGERLCPQRPEPMKAEASAHG